MATLAALAAPHGSRCSWLLAALGQALSLSSHGCLSVLSLLLFSTRKLDTDLREHPKLGCSDLEILSLLISLKTSFSNKVTMEDCRGQ